MTYIIALEGMDAGGMQHAAYFKVKSDQGPAETKDAIETSLAKNSPGTRVIGFLPVADEVADTPSDDAAWRELQKIMGHMLSREN